MSALGHKRTFALQEGMSALHPKADMCSALGDVRFVPIADIRGHQPWRGCLPAARAIIATTRVVKHRLSGNPAEC